MPVKLHSRKWTDAYPPGKPIEFLYGVTWRLGVVVERTRSGLPIVSIVGDRTCCTFRVDRKRDIREASTTPPRGGIFPGAIGS